MCTYRSEVACGDCTCTEHPENVCTWLREMSSCPCLTVLPGPAWVLLSNTNKPLFPPLYCTNNSVSIIQAKQVILPVAPAECGREEGDGEEEEVDDEDGEQRLVVVAHQVARPAGAVVEDGLRGGGGRRWLCSSVPLY